MCHLVLSAVEEVDGECRRRHAVDFGQGGSEHRGGSGPVGHAAPVGMHLDEKAARRARLTRNAGMGVVRRGTSRK